MVFRLAPDAMVNQNLSLVHLASSKKPPQHPHDSFRMVGIRESDTDEGPFHMFKLDAKKEDIWSMLKRELDPRNLGHDEGWIGNAAAFNS